jgi:predicted GNAT family acetyltransferase
MTLRALFAELAAPELSLHVQADALDALSAHYMPIHVRAIVRMALEPAAFRPVDAGDVRSIDENDSAAVSALYAEGHARGEGPTFFTPAMLRLGTFRGVWEAGALVAIAGSHLYSPALGVCTIGNVYTRRDRRGQGLAARVTSAVVTQALTDRIPTIVLNVTQDNVTARRVYARLGFAPYCDFFEGTARLRRTKN